MSSFSWLIVLDLDGTVVKTVDYKPSVKFNDVYQVTFFSEIENKTKTMWVMLRRSMIDFIKSLSFNGHQIGIWSAGQPNYVNTISNLLHELTNVKLEFVYNWTHCHRHSCGKIFKPLSECPNYHSRIILIDDSCSNVNPHHHDDGHMILIPRYNPRCCIRNTNVDSSLSYLSNHLHYCENIIEISYILPLPLRFIHTVLKL
jgi:hypothetical protein